MGIMTSISMFVTMLLSPFCGSIVDKCNRKWVIVGIDILQGLLMLSVGILAYLNVLNVPIVLLSAFLASLGAIKLTPRVRFLVMSLSFTLSIPATIAVYFSTRFVPMCIFAFIAGFLNCAGNSVFNAAMMLALPEKNRSAILGFVRSASVGGTAVSAVAYGFLGEIFPLYLVFAAGSAVSLIPMIYTCFHPAVKRFILTH